MSHQNVDCGLRVRSLTKHFLGVTALKEFSADFKAGQVTGLIGPNGAGKTTLFDLCTGTQRPDEGDIIHQGKSLLSLSVHQRARLGLARTFQEVRLPWGINCLEAAMLVATRHDRQPRIARVAAHLGIRKPTTESSSECVAALESIGLEHLTNTLVDDLSYGQQKLLGLLCCLWARPNVALLDEPAAGLSSSRKEETERLVTALASEGCCVIVIEHNMQFLRKVCDKLVFMAEGKKVLEGTPDDVFVDRLVVKHYFGDDAPC